MEVQQKYLMEAFRNDCQTLITRFELSYNTHFQNFCEIWRDMQFSLIFTCHPSDLVLTMFCEDALCVTKQFLTNASGLKERIGALYLIYGIYYKMPKNTKLKIRMTLSDWKCLTDLHQQIKAEEYLDANYILCKLIVDQAFIHCISDNMYGIEKHFHKKQEKPMLDFNLMPEIKELAAPGKLLATISQLSKVYDKKKHSLFNAEASNVQLYDVNIADDIIDSIRTVQSESRIFAKSTSVNITEPSCSKQLPSTSAPNNETVQKNKKRIRNRKEAILSKIGRAFEKGLQSESSEEEMCTNSEADPLA